MYGSQLTGTPAAALASALTLAGAVGATTIDFEPDADGLLPDGSPAIDNLSLSDQYLLSSGVRFAIDDDRDGTPDPDVTAFLEAAGENDPTSGFSNDALDIDDTAAPGFESRLGSYFVRAAEATSNLLILYDVPTAAAAGEIWDIDGNATDQEQWEIEVLDADGVVIDSLTSPLGEGPALDGRPYLWAFDYGPDARIHAIRMNYVGTTSTRRGVAFDNFSPISVPGPLLSATKRVDGVFEPAGAITYTIEIRNDASVEQPDNPGDELTDTLPPEVLLLGASASSGTVETIGDTVTWNGTVPPFGTVTLVIEAQIEPTAAGQVITNQATVRTDPDGDGTNDVELVTDDPETPEPGDPTRFDIPCHGSLIEVEIFTDAFGSETTWEIVNDCTDELVATGGPYEGDTLYQEQLCVDPRCEYTFTIFDLFGDGICCAFGPGYYDVKLDGTSVAHGDIFPELESTPLNPGAGCSGPCAACELAAELRRDVVLPGGELVADIFVRHNLSTTVWEPFEIWIEDDAGRLLGTRRSLPYPFRRGQSHEVTERVWVPETAAPGLYQLVFQVDGMQQGRAIRRLPFRVLSQP